MSAQSSLAILPMWLQAVSIVGFPILVASFVLLQDAGYFRSVNADNARVLAEVVIQHEVLLTQQAEQVRLAREVCKNTAKTMDDIQRCFPQVAQSGRQ